MRVFFRLKGDIREHVKVVDGGKERRKKLSNVCGTVDVVVENVKFINEKRQKFPHSLVCHSHPCTCPELSMDRDNNVNKKKRGVGRERSTETIRPLVSKICLFFFRK
jgi:hypothetical protein